MPRTKQNNPKNLKDKIEEAQKELKDPKSSPKGAPESGRRNVDKSQSLKRKKVVAGNQLKKIPKSPVKKPLQSKPSDPAAIETPSDKTPTLCSSSASNSPIHNPTSPTGEPQDAQNAQATPKLPKQSLPNTERVKEEQKSPSFHAEDANSEPSQAAEISKIQSPKREEEPFQTSAPLDVLLKAMEPDFSTLADRKNPAVGKVAEVQAVPTALNVGIHPAPLQTYYIDKQGNFIGIAAPTAQGLPNFVPVANQEKPRLQMSFNAGPVAITHAPVPQSQPPIVQTCQSLSASVPSSIQVPVTPGSNQVQMATVMTFGNEISKDQKLKKPGKYVCEYCNRACAKPSVLLKHIRSHTGERPYPCVTCGFSFKTKSNLYKHKKSHAHAIKLGLMARSESGGGSMSQESEKGIGTHSEAEESGESDEEGSNAELEQDLPQSNVVALSEGLTQGEAEQSSAAESCKMAANQKSHEPKVTAALPKVVVYPVNVSPLRADSPRVTMAAPEQAAARQREFQSASLRSSITVLSSLKEVDGASASLDVSEDEDQQCKSPLLGGHAQLQRQQATDFSQQQQPKCLLSPRSLGSTDSGYFSRSESADQAMSPPSPFVKITPPVEIEKNNMLSNLPPLVATVMHVQSETKVRSVMEGQMRPPLEPKALSLEERISKLISDNEAVVDNKQLDSVKPRRTSLSRRGSIDSPKSYIFKDSFQFDLKPIGRSSSSSDIPKSPFTPTDKSKPVFLLSVPPQYPPMDCLPITRSNSMPTTPGHSALPVNVPPLPHPLRICHSFDEKMGTFNDDVFSSAPTTPNPAMHARTLVRQVAVEDFSTSHEGHGLLTVRSMDEGYHGPASNLTELMQRSRSVEDKNRKPSQNKGTMYECETCRNRYRKLENFETHKKFYCSELHGPKKKDVEQEVFHVHMQQPFVRRVVSGSGIDQQTSFRKRRMKMKSVGDEDDQSPTDTVPPCSVSLDSGQLPAAMANRPFPPHAVIVDIQPKNSQNKLPQIQLVARGTSDARLSPIRETKMANKGELQRQGSGTSVIRHTNSLSRPNSFETESMDRASPVESMDKDPANKPKADQVANISIDTCRESKLSKSVDYGKQRVAQFGDRESCEIPTTPVHQSRLVRQNNIQVPEILVTEEPDRENESQNVDLTEKQADQFSWPQRSESLSKLPAEKLPPKKKRIRLAQMDQSSGESSLESSLSRSLSRDSSLSRGSSISASFDREESLRSESPSRVDCVNKSADLQGLPAAFNTLNVPGVMRRAASEQITCTQPSVEISSDYRSKSFDCGNVSPSRSLSPVALPKSGQISQVPLIERRRGPLVKQMSLKIGPESQQPVRKSIAPLEKVANVYSLTQTKPQQIHIANRSTAIQPFVLQSGEQPMRDNEQLVQSINLGSPTLQPQIHGLPHPWHQTSRVQVCQKTQQPQNQILVCRENLPNKPTETNDKTDFVPKYQLPCATLRPSQTFTFSNTPGAQIALPVLTIPIANPVLGISKSPEADAVVLQGQPQASAVPLPQILITHEQIHHVPKVPKNVRTPTTEILSKRENSPIRVSHPCSNVELASSIGPIQCTQKLASVTLCPQQEPTASSKRMLSPANSLDIYMEKHQKRAKDEHGVACLTDGRSVNYLNSKMSEITRQRKLMLVRQSCTTEPADSPIETEAPPLSPPKAEVEKDGEVGEDEVKPMSPDSTGLEKETCTIIPEESCPTISTSQSGPVSKPQDKTEDQKWPPAKSPIRPSSFHSGQVKLTTSVSVVNTKDSHRLSFPSLKTTTTLTWCFLMKRKSLHTQQTDLKTSAYTAWTVSPNNPNPLGLPTKVVMSLFDSRQSSKKILYTSAIKTSGAKDLLSYSGKLKDVMPKVPLIQKSKSVEARSKPPPEIQSSLESDKEPTAKSEPRRVKIFDGGYKSNEEYVYVRGRGRGKYICEECGIRCKKPSMLRKHIRTHSDVRPYHCAHCNFSFKTKGNLTKHMKSKAHSKKCLEMGVPDGVIDDQEAEDSGDRSHMGSADRPDSDDSDAPEDEDDNEEEEDDSQAESGLSTNPSVSASPQHFPGRESDAPPSALLAQMSISAVLPLTSCVSDSDSVPMLSPKLLTASAAANTALSERAPGRDDVPESPSAAGAPSGGAAGEVSDSDSVHMMSPVSPCRQMSIDFPDFEVPPSPPALGSKAARSAQDVSPAPPTAPSAELSVPVDRGTQTSCFPAHTPLLFPQNPLPASTAPPAGPSGLFPPLGPGESHLFSHLPLHSQQPPRSSYSMLPVGGIQLVPAYSAFVPIQAGQVQLTIPAVGVIHRNTSPLPAPSLSPRDGEGVQPQPLLVQDPSSAFPCFTQTLQPVNLETLNIMGIANTGLASTQLLPQQGLTLNATLGLQVLAANPTSQSSTGPHHVPGLQIVNIALPAIIPSVSPISALSPLPGGVERQGSPETHMERGQSPAKMSPAPVEAASSPLRSNASPVNASIETKPPSGGKQEESADTEQRKSPILESQTAKPAKTWQKLNEDYDNEASSDDEDRLVIAT